MTSYVFENFLTLASGFSPVIAYLFLKSSLEVTKKMVYCFAGALTFLSLILVSGISFNAVNVSNPILYALILSSYPFMMLILLPFLTKKYGLKNGLVLTVMIGFLFTELHEIIGFAKMYLGFFDNILARESYLVWYSPLNHLYFILVFALACKIAGFNKIYLLAFSGLFLDFLAFSFIIYGNLSYGVYDFWDFARRFIWLPFMFLLFIFCWDPKRKEIYHL